MRIVLSLTLLAVLIQPALAYDNCGDPPEAPALPDPVTATTDDIARMRIDDQALAEDTEGYLICLQLAESDVQADATTTAAQKRALMDRFQDQAANARGNRSRWIDEYRGWFNAWVEAHPGTPVPSSRE